MATTRRHKEDFPMFAELAPLIPEECREEVRETMQRLENVWRDDLCKATIVLLTKGKRKPYNKSRVMQVMFERVLKTLSAPKSLSAHKGHLPLNGEGLNTIL